MPGRDQPGDDRAELGSGDRGGVIGRAEADRVQHRGPRRARLQRGDEITVGLERLRFEVE